MTGLLEKAFTEAARLSEIEQNALARWILEELASQQRWDKRFAESEDALSNLASEALDEHRRDETQPMDPEDL